MVDSLLLTHPHIDNITAIDAVVDKRNQLVSFTLCWEVSDRDNMMAYYNIYHDSQFLGRSYNERFRVAKMHYHDSKAKLYVQPVTNNGFKYFGDSMSCLIFNIVKQ